MSVNSIQEYEKFEEKDIYNILNQTVHFSEKPQIIFYGKGNFGIYGYLQIANKTFYFEIRINKLMRQNEYAITVKIGKMIIVKKVQKVI